MFARVLDLKFRKLSNATLFKSIIAIGWSSYATAVAALVFLPSADGYELSIYDAIPSWIWILLFISIVLAMIGLAVIHEMDLTNRHRILALSLAICINTTVLLIPSFRGYPSFYRGDAQRHIGLIRQTLTHNHILDNFYPIIHIHGGVLLDLFNIPYGSTAHMVVAIYYIAYLIGMFILIRMFFDYNKRFLYFLIALPFVYSKLHTIFHPAYLSFFLVPLFFYIYHRYVVSSEFGFRVILLALTVILILGHPANSIVSIFLILVPIIVISVVQLYSPEDEQLVSFDILLSSIKSSHVLFICFVAVIWWAWYISFFEPRGVFITMVVNLLTKFGPAQLPSSGTVTINDPSPIENIMGRVAESGLTPQQILRIIFFKYGSLGIYYLMFAVGVFYAVKKKRKRLPTRKLIQIGFQLLASWIVVGVFTFSNLILHFQRVLRWSTIFLVLFIVAIIEFHSLDGRTFNERRLATVVTCLSIVALVISYFSVFPAPINGEPNAQITQQNLDGTQWLHTYQTDNATVINSHAGLHRTAQYYRYPEPNRWTRGPIPSHFGYDNGSAAPELKNRPGQYLYTTELDREFPEIFPQNVNGVNKYTAADFEQLTTDSSFQKGYDNGEVKIWYPRNNSRSGQ